VTVQFVTVTIVNGPEFRGQVTFTAHVTSSDERVIVGGPATVTISDDEREAICYILLVLVFREKIS